MTAEQRTVFFCDGEGCTSHMLPEDSHALRWYTVALRGRSSHFCSAFCLDAYAQHREYVEEHLEPQQFQRNSEQQKQSEEHPA